MSQAIFETCGVAFQSNVLFYQCFHNFIQNFLICVIGIVPVFVWTVADYIVNMTAAVKTGKSLQIFQKNLEISEVTFVFCAPLKINIFIRIHAVYYMGGTNEK